MYISGKDDRKDDPINTLYLYKALNATIIDRLNELNKIDSFNFDELFNMIISDIKKCIKDISGAALIISQNNSYLCLNTDNLKILYKDNKDKKDSNEIDIDLNNYKQIETLIWNYKDDALPLSEGNPIKEARLFMWIANLHTYEQLYLYLVRKKEDDPLIAQEIDAVKIISRLISLTFSNNYSNDFVDFLSQKI